MDFCNWVRHFLKKPLLLIPLSWTLLAFIHPTGILKMRNCDEKCEFHGIINWGSAAHSTPVDLHRQKMATESFYFVAVHLCVWHQNETSDLFWPDKNFGQRKPQYYDWYSYLPFFRPSAYLVPVRNMIVFGNEHELFAGLKP